MTDFLLLAFIFLVAGVIAVPIASKLGLGSVLGYLIAGILISPILSLLEVDLISIQHFAEFGVVMMLFLVGLELEPKLLWEMRHKLFGLGGLQVALTTGIVFLIAMMAADIAWQTALAIGFVFSLSSTAIVLQTLNEKGLMKSDGGQSSFSVLLFQDIAVIPILAAIPLLAVPELLEQNAHLITETHDASLDIFHHLNSIQMASVTVGAIVFVLFFGSFLTRPIFRFIAVAKLRELFTATALMMVIGIALLMTLVGLSPALGTFIAGVVLANSEYRHELESDIAPFKGLLLGLFFITVGANINFTLLSANLAIILMLTFGLIALKMLVLGVLSIIFRLQGSDRLLLTLSLAQAGEFGFVLLSFTVASSVIPKAMADQLLIVVALSMLLTPLIFILFEKLQSLKYSKQAQDADEIEEENDIIIIGHGRVGGIINRMLRGAGYKTTAIDFSSEQLELLRTFGLSAFFGDGTRPDLLHAANIEDAKLLIVAIDSKESSTELVHYVVKTYPKLHVVARAIDRTHVYDLWSVGCRDIIRETFDGSIRMGRSALIALGHKETEVEAMIEKFKGLDRQAMLDTADLYSRDIPDQENKAYVDKVKEIIKQWEDELLGKSPLQTEHLDKEIQTKN